MLSSFYVLNVSIPQGDYIAKDVELPEVTPGDWLLIHDTGAYCYAMYSHYNSIIPGAVYGYERDEQGDIKFQCFKERASVEETLEFWGNEVPRNID